MKIRPVGAEFHADGRTEILRTRLKSFNLVPTPYVSWDSKTYDTFVTHTLLSP